MLTLIVIGFALPGAAASPHVAYGVWLALWVAVAVHRDALWAAQGSESTHGTSVFGFQMRASCGDTLDGLYLP